MEPFNADMFLKTATMLGIMSTATVVATMLNMYKTWSGLGVFGWIILSLGFIGIYVVFNEHTLMVMIGAGFYGVYLGSMVNKTEKVFSASSLLKRPLQLFAGLAVTLLLAAVGTASGINMQVPLITDWWPALAFLGLYAVDKLTANPMPRWVSWLFVPLALILMWDGFNQIAFPEVEVSWKYALLTAGSINLGLLLHWITWGSIFAPQAPASAEVAAE